MNERTRGDRQAEFVSAVEDWFPVEQIKLEPSDLQTWGTDWTRNFNVDPLAIVFPRTIDQVAELVRLAPSLGIQLVPSGGRTGLSGGAVASRGEIVVSMDRMNSILEFNAVDRVVRCQAGLITQQLQEFAVSKGLYYPVDFASSGSSQIGGNIATNAGGIRVIRHGMTRQWVVGLTVVTGRGEVLKLNHGLVKNATGYDLRHFFIGSEGTLGFIVEADIRLTAPPLPQRVMVLGVERLDDLLNILRNFQDRLSLSAFEFFSHGAMQKVISHRKLSPPLEHPTMYYALLEYDVQADGIALEVFNEVLERGWITDGVVSQSDAQASALWELREGISESIAPSTPYKNDISVRTSEIPGFLHDVDKIVNEHYPDFEVIWFGHIGDGNLHLNILRPESWSMDEFYERCHEISPLLFELIQRRRGSISAEHGVGLLKREFLGFTRSESELDLMRELKHVFDPCGIMNPGKLLVTD